MKYYFVNKEGSQDYFRFSSEEDAQKYCRYMKDEQGEDNLQISVKDSIIDDIPKLIPVSGNNKFKSNPTEIFEILKSAKTGTFM